MYESSCSFEVKPLTQFVSLLQYCTSCCEVKWINRPLLFLHFRSDIDRIKKASAQNDSPGSSCNSPSIHCVALYPDREISVCHGIDRLRGPKNNGCQSLNPGESSIQDAPSSTTPLPTSKAALKVLHSSIFKSSNKLMRIPVVTRTSPFLINDRSGRSVTHIST